jgi:squalene synthase HpnC
MEELLDSSLSGHYPADDDTEKIFRALVNTINELSIPDIEFRKLLKAFRQDCVKSKYETLTELLEYSDNSANPVGHLVLNVFGYERNKDTDLFKLSDKICTALQLTNFWQDVSIDLAMSRIYIPAEIMLKFGYYENMLFGKVENDDFRRMMSELVTITQNLFNEGSVLSGHVNGRLKYELRATVKGGERILGKIRKINYGVLSERVKINPFDKLSILTSSLIG